MFLTNSCSVNSCDFGASMGGDGLRVLLPHRLGQVSRADTEQGLTVLIISTLHILLNPIRPIKQVPLFPFTDDETEAQ